MINELYQLSEAMDRAGVQAQHWHRRYNPIPDIKPKAPCVRINISNGTVVELSSIPERLGSGLRKFVKGTSQGSYPCMNLAPLYRITDETTKAALAAFKPENIDSNKIAEIKSWCQNNNWGRKVQELYIKSMKNRAAELLTLAPKYKPLQILVEESNYFLDPMVLHRELEAAIFKMLKERENVSLALQILFYKANAEEDYGSLSVAFETSRLIDEMGFPAISRRFVLELNDALLEAKEEGTGAKREKSYQESIPDAFGIPFTPINEPMPKVKLAGGFDVSLRTMFRGQPCQTRYGQIEDAGYPISLEMRKKLSASMDWLGGSKERENITWMNIDKGEILFAYPSRMLGQNISYTRMFGRPKKNDVTFEEQAKQFLTELQHGREAGVDAKADQIQLFILKKIDKARVKVVYTRQTDAHELEKCSEAWLFGCSNLPAFYFGTPKVPFPLEAANALNCFWKQNGERATDKYRPVPQYHGLELLMSPDFPVTADLHMLSEKSRTIGEFLGGLLAENDLYHPIWERITEMLALIGLMLYRKGIGKERYMEGFPYQYGQLLKVSDELHAMYCRVVRRGDFPPQLAGSSVYQAAAEMPLRTMSVLAQRMQPYIAWAKSYHTGDDSKKGNEAWRAKWLLQMYEEIAGKLKAVWTADMRFNDEEKAQLFIGYLAAYPKRELNKDRSTEYLNQVEEVQRS